MPQLIRRLGHRQNQSKKASPQPRRRRGHLQNKCKNVFPSLEESWGIDKTIVKMHAPAWAKAGASACPSLEEGRGIGKTKCKIACPSLEKGPGHRKNQCKNACPSLEVVWGISKTIVEMHAPA